MANQFGGFQSFGQQDQGLTVDQLLNAAKLQGGRVAEVAEELSNPRRSILSTVGDKFKNAFTGFLDIIAMPNQIVAGAIDNEITIKQAMKDNISTSDVIAKKFWGDKDIQNMSFAGKAANFGARLAVDVLLDPLTYVTFGASRGIFGLSQATKAYAGEKTASKLGLKNIGDKFALSETAEGLANDYVMAQRNGTHAGFFTKNRERILEMVGGNMDDAAKLNTNLALREFDDEMSDILANQVLNSRLSKSFAVDTVSRLIEKHPALIETLVDKGGIKFFNKTLLSAQRIKSINALIPGMSLIDNFTLPARNMLGAAFSRNYVFDPKNPRASGRLPDIVIDTAQKYRDLAESNTNELLATLPKAFKELKITPEEDKFIFSAIQYGIKPADAKAADIWNLVNGFPPENGYIRPEVYKAMGVTKERIEKDFQRRVLAGELSPNSNLENYIGNFLVKEPVSTRGFTTPPTTKGQKSKFAKLSALLDEQGNRFITALDKAPNKTTGEVTGTMIKNGEKIPVKFNVDGDVWTEQLKTETGRVVSGAAYTRAKATALEAKMFGVEFNQSAITAALLGSAEATKVSTGRHFLKEMAEKSGVRASEAPADYVAVKATGLKFDGDDLANHLVNPSGEPILFHPLIAKYIEEFTDAVGTDGATEGIMKAYDKIQNVFKASVTSIFPSFHGRNAISNVMLAFMDIGHNALNPVNHVEVANIALMNVKHNSLQKAMVLGKEGAPEEFSKLMQTKMFKDITGYEWSFGELRDVIHNNVVAFHPRNLGQIDQAQFGIDKKDLIDTSEWLFPNTAAAKAKKIGKAINPLSTKNKAIEKGLQVGAVIEDHARMLVFLQNLKQSGDPLSAAMKTKQFLFDYQNLSNFERKVLRRIIPFYTFSRKNIELQVKTLFSRPGVIAGEVRAVQTIGDVLGGGDLSEEERAALPGWMQDGINTVLSRKGSHLEILSTIGSPIEQPFQQIQPNQALASISPIMRVPVELMAGYSFFHGKALSEVTNAAAYQYAPDAIKDFIGFTEVTGETKDGKKFTYYASLRPERMHLFGNLPPMQRVWSSVKQLTKDDVSTNTKVWQFLIGFNPYEFDIEVEQARREKELKEELENVLDTANVGYRVNRFIIPKQDDKIEKF